MASDGFRPLDEKLLVEYVKATPVLAEKLGNQFDKLEIEEVGDGNLNFVYIVISPSGSLVIKQVTRSVLSDHFLEFDRLARVKTKKFFFYLYIYFFASHYSACSRYI